MIACDVDCANVELVEVGLVEVEMRPCNPVQTVVAATWVQRRQRTELRWPRHRNRFPLAATIKIAQRGGLEASAETCS